MADGESIWTYSPSIALAIVVAIIYLVPTLVLLVQTCFKYRSWFFVCVLIGSSLEVGGYICRAVSAKRPSEIVSLTVPFINTIPELDLTCEQPPYAVSSTLIIIAPVFVAAGNYLLIGRLITAVLPSTHHRIFFIPAHLITRVFVACDILSLLIQASGSGIASSGNWEGDEAKTGTNVLIGGLVLQVATFAWFLSIVVRFWVVTKHGVKEGAPKGWRVVGYAIWVSSVLILVRRDPQFPQ